MTLWLTQLFIILHSIGFFILIEDTYNLIPIPEELFVNLGGVPIEHYWVGYIFLITPLFFLLPLANFLIWLNIVFWILSYVLTRRYTGQIIYSALLLVFILVFNIVILGEIYPVIPTLYGLIFSVIITLWIALRDTPSKGTVVTFTK